MKDKKKWTLLAAIIAVGFSLRPGLTGIGSLLRLIKPDMGLSDTVAGLLTTIPMLTFAAFSPLTWRVNDRLGTARTIYTAFALIIAGILLRSFGGRVGLFLGTLLIGVGIAFGNVIMPAIIKGEFPEKYGFVTALNSAALAVASGVASGVNYPAASAGLGWRGALCIWAVVALIGALCWMAGGRRVQIRARAQTGGIHLFGSKVAWAVTLFLGIVALLFYSCASWLATIFQAKGLDAATAGYYVSAFQMTGIVSSFLVPMLAGRSNDQRRVTYCVLGIFLVGIVLMALTRNPALLLIAALCAGVGCNGSFALSMGFIGFRARGAEDTAALSAMSQSIGYIIAAVGPMGMGWIYNLCGSWNVNLWIIAALLLALFGVSSVCAKDGSV